MPRADQADSRPARRRIAPRSASAPWRVRRARASMPRANVDCHAPPLAPTAAARTRRSRPSTPHIRAIEFGQPLVSALRDPTSSARKRFAPGDDISPASGPYLRFSAIEQREAILDLLQLRRRRLDAVGVPTQKERQIFELRLDAVLRLEIRLESGSSAARSATRRQTPPRLASTAPSLSYKRRIAFRAQPLDTLRAGQHGRDAPRVRRPRRARQASVPLDRAPPS